MPRSLALSALLTTHQHYTIHAPARSSGGSHLNPELAVGSRKLMSIVAKWNKATLHSWLVYCVSDRRGVGEKISYLPLHLATHGSLVL